MDGIYLSKIIAACLYPLNLSLLLLCIAGLFFLFKKSKWAKSSLVVSLLILLISASPPISSLLIRHLEHQHSPFEASDAPVADAILILGGAVALPQTPRVDIELVGSSDRVRYAGQLYRENKAKKIVIAGGNVFEQNNLRGEAYYIAQLLLEWGVSEADILFEDQSRNTYENAYYAKPLLKSNDLSTILLVTSAIHMPRAYAVFAAQDIDVIAAPTDILVVNNDMPGIFDWIPSATALANTTSALKEYMGWYYYRVRGYI